MAAQSGVIRESVLGLKYAGASLVGFATDVILLHLVMAIGLEPAWARVISLLAAMQVTFVINGLHVFRRLRLRRLPVQWVRYMLSNGLGNLANYWIFVTLVSLHWRWISLPLTAMSIGALLAWVVNYASTRFWVFARARRGRGQLRAGGWRE
jgi:putative flippase GtrA